MSKIINWPVDETKNTFDVDGLLEDGFVVLGIDVEVREEGFDEDGLLDLPKNSN